MKKFIIVIAAFLLISPIIKAQKTDNYLIINNGHRAKKLYALKNFNEFKIYSEIRLDNGLDSSIYVAGSFKEVVGNKVLIDFHEMDVMVGDCDSSTISKQYYKCQCSPTAIDVSNIYKIEYQSDRSANWLGGSYLLLSSGILTSLVIAPLISIKYSNGDFNQKRYYKTVALGAAMIGISIPMSILSKKKTFYFKIPEGKTNKKLWKVGAQK